MMMGICKTHKNLGGAKGEAKGNVRGTRWEQRDAALGALVGICHRLDSMGLVFSSLDDAVVP